MPDPVHGRTLAEWRAALPQLDAVMERRPTLWINPALAEYDAAVADLPFNNDDLSDAEARLARFAPYLARAFPETRERDGIIESPLRETRALAERLQAVFGWQLRGRLLLKCDNQLAVSGSIKARGGFYEVLKFAETLALEHGLIDTDGDYARFADDDFHALFARHSLAVGSTGNLGLSIGVMGARLGFATTVHMSADARQWKKDLLRARGVSVIEYESDYGEAVRQGRAQAAGDPSMHFVDDENSVDLFLGYAVAALRLRQQLDALGVTVDAEHPLCVYLPCGVGGGPGGIAFGLKQVFGDAVHCFFAEPVASPCMLLGMMTGLHERVDVRDFGLDNRTEADGLAVARPSGFVGRTLARLLGGIYTIQDEMLFRLLALVRDAEHIDLEPSAAAGLTGPAMLLESEAGRAYREARGLAGGLERVTHLAWATGGGLVPATEMDAYYRRGLFACG